MGKKREKSVVGVPGVPGALLSMLLTAWGCGGNAPGASPGNSPGCWETASPKRGETSPNSCIQMRLCSAPALIPLSGMREESGGSLLTGLCVGAALMDHSELCD